ncbi:MAG: pilus assembly protein PilM [Coprobacillus sp.]
MIKENVIYISNENLQFISGEVQRDAVRISDYFHIPLREGTMLNGVIIDDYDVKDTLKKLKEKGITEVKLVIDSAKILAKPAVVPIMKEKEVIQFVKDELSSIDTNSEDIIYDYAYLGEDESAKGASKILCVGVERKFIQSYVDLFADEGIEIIAIEYAIDVLISLTKQLPGFLDKTYAIMEVDGSNLTSVVFMNNEYSLTNRSRVFSTKGTDEYETEILNAVSLLKQFSSSSEAKKPISDIYIFGLNEQTQASLFEKIELTLNVKAQTLPRSKSIYTTKQTDKKFDINDYVYPIGYLQK